MDGKPMPKSITEGQPIAQLMGKKNALKCLGPQHEFERYGKSGQFISNQFPKIGSIADDICIIRSMHTEQINHDPAHTYMNTGTQISGRPSMGSWILYGLGADTENLPGFVVLTSVGGGQNQPIASRQWHSGFLPSKYQGVHFHSKGDPVLYLSNPKGVTAKDQRSLIDSVNKLNLARNASLRDPEISTKVSQYEMAFRMQTSVPELMDASNEPKHASTSTEPSPETDPSPATAYSPEDWPSGVRFHTPLPPRLDHHGGVKNAITGVAARRPRLCGTHSGPQTKRYARRHPRSLGRRIRTHPHGARNGRDHHIKGFSI